MNVCLNVPSFFSFAERKQNGTTNNAGESVGVFSEAKRTKNLIILSAMKTMTINETPNKDIHSASSSDTTTYRMACVLLTKYIDSAHNALTIQTFSKWHEFFFVTVDPSRCRNVVIARMLEIRWNSLHSTRTQHTNSRTLNPKHS